MLAEVVTLDPSILAGGVFVVLAIVIAMVVQIVLGILNRQELMLSSARAEEIRLATVQVAVRAEEVRQNLIATTEAARIKLDAMQKTILLTHDLVNSSSLAQMSLHAVALRRIAFLTCDPDDAIAATKAECSLQEQRIKQDAAQRRSALDLSPPGV